MSDRMGIVNGAKGEKMSDDLISRKAAIDMCRKPHMRNADCSDFELEIMMLPSAQRWIPATERLPEENKPVLVTHHGKYQAFVSVDWIDPYTHEWNRTCNVTAWQPLPEPWKGADDDRNG